MPDRGLPLLYTGSVKDVFGRAGQDPYVFSFSDRYSIFDWGEMPDMLAGKGEALAILGDLFFRQLERADTWLSWHISEAYPKFWRDSITASSAWARFRREGLCHHSLGLVDEQNQALSPGSRTRRLAVCALSRPPATSSVVNGKVQWDYSAYKNRPAKALVPLEVVFRFGAPAGSSFLERLDKDPNYALSFGFPEKPEAGDWFPFPVVEFFTKLEPTDRFLSREEARSIAGLSTEEIDDLVAVTLLAALRLKDIFSAVGLELWDGKFEFAFGATGSFQMVDSIGPDELRLIGAGGVHFSKEYLRRVYRGTAWYEAVGKAKKLANERGLKDWKKICVEELRQEPLPLPAKELECARSLYPVLVDALAKDFLGRPVYGDLPSVTALCQQMREGV